MPCKGGRVHPSWCASVSGAAEAKIPRYGHLGPTTAAERGEAAIAAAHSSTAEEGKGAVLIERVRGHF
eukprot:6215885-Alexandrium_andersonii.AAC.1